MDYDELIKNLREAAGEILPWETPYILMVKAADAIEDLMKKLVIAEDQSGLYDALPMTVIRAKPEWISVDRQLPDANGFYLALYEHKHPGGVAMDSGLSILQYLNKEWHLNENYVVTHWFPIPEAPKDAEEDE